MVTERARGGPEGELIESARGWHRLQLAVLGFIGLCGVIQAGAEVPGPTWLDPVAGWLALGSLLLACVATYLVGRVAWPWATSTGDDGAGGEVRAGPVRTLRAGVALTYLAVVAITLAALANWWPAEDTGGAGTSGDSAVQVTEAGGRSWCGRLVDAPPGSLRILTDQGPATIDGSTVTAVVSVDRC